MQRLDKILANFKNISRKDAKALIASGKVLVNKSRAESPGQQIADTDEVCVCGEILNTRPFVYYMMNKPAGVICATTDAGCKTVLDLLPENMLRKGLFPAGRLDKDTEGFVLITDDGAFAHSILAPKNHVPKTYYAVLDGEIGDSLILAFRDGLELSGGDTCSPAKLEVLENSPLCSRVNITIYEGMYHQIKRMFVKFGLNVTYLKRISIGGLELDKDLPSAHTKEILHKELKLIAEFL